MEILVLKEDEEHVCVDRPLCVQENAAFVISNSVSQEPRRLVE